jgi:hypothetical protein
MTWRSVISDQRPPSTQHSALSTQHSALNTQHSATSTRAPSTSWQQIALEHPALGTQLSREISPNTSSFGTGLLLVGVVVYFAAKQRQAASAI